MHSVRKNVYEKRERERLVVVHGEEHGLFYEVLWVIKMMARQRSAEEFAC